MDTITTNRDLERFDGLTPTFQSLREFEDADDELQPIAEYIKQHTVHNADIEPRRVKFLYTDKPTKVGGRFVLTKLIKRSDMEKMINDDFDFIVTIYYEAWRVFKGEQKVVIIDKALCGIDMGNMEKQKISKKAPDSMEYLENMNHFTPKTVMEVSEMVHLTCVRIEEEKKEEKKKTKHKQNEE